MLAKHQKYWNEKWIIIPNPIYGGWEGALYNFDYCLSKEQIFEQKLNSLDTFETFWYKYFPFEENMALNADDISEQQLTFNDSIDVDPVWSRAPV